jgi:hypothetical protein
MFDYLFNSAFPASRMPPLENPTFPHVPSRNSPKINTSKIFAIPSIPFIRNTFNPTRINTSKNKDLKSLRINTSENKDLKPLRINTSKNTLWGRLVPLIPNAITPAANPISSKFIPVQESIPSRYNPRVDHHTVAAVSIAGSCLDVLGTLYLAYDLLGGQHGPLRLLTRAVTYSIVFGLGYGLGMWLGPFLGLITGAATGITISIEMNRTARGLKHFSWPWEALFGAIRSFAFAVGIYKVLGVEFAVAFAILSSVGQGAAYSRGMRPGTDYSANRGPRFTHRQFVGTVARALGYLAAALLAGLIVHNVDHLWAFALRVGIVAGVVSGVGITFNPYIEYYADNLPPRWLGAIGVGLIFFGFALQSLQYWLTIFDVRIT